MTKEEIEMLLPSLMNGNFFDDWMPDFPSGKDFFRGTGTNGMMKTDVKETEKTFELEMDLPGFKKEDVTAKLDSGYLTISASRNEENDEKDEDGKYIRRERYTGSCSRSFYVGENVTEEDIQAKFDNGTLKLSIPKDIPKKVEEQKFISIEG